MASLADLAAAATLPPTGVRVMLDLRPLQEPARAPMTATYLRSLVHALGRDPLADEEVIEVLRVGRDDPMDEARASMSEAGLAVVGRRWLPPPSNALRSLLGVPVDGVLLRAAQVRARTGTGVGTVFHTAGGTTPRRSSMPVVSAVLDLAPWELPERYTATRVARLARRAKAAAMRRASLVLVASRATADAVSRLVEVERERIRVVPLAADEAFRPAAADPGLLDGLLAAHRLPPRYLIVGGRYDARSDLPTLLAALRSLRDGGTAEAELPHVVLVGVASADEAHDRIAALVRHHQVRDLVHATPPISLGRRAVLEAGAVGHVQVALSDATGLAAMEALAAGVPVIASRAGALPEVVGPAGIIVEPGDPARLANALVALWSDGTVAEQVTRAARRAAETRRTWADVCRETREAWASVVGTPAAPPAPDALG
jgi:glycosyltransferase involved in cell wall biosynthesis